jgi:hypothetical protein
MEKFSRFNDARSGVNPFAQQPYRPTPGQLIGGGLFGLVKLPLLALVFGLLWIVTQVSAFVSPWVPGIAAGVDGRATTLGLSASTNDSLCAESCTSSCKVISPNL